MTSLSAILVFFTFASCGSVHLHMKNEYNGVIEHLLQRVSDLEQKVDILMKNKCPIQVNLVSETEDAQRLLDRQSSMSSNQVPQTDVNLDVNDQFGEEEPMKKTTRNQRLMTKERRNQRQKRSPTNFTTDAFALAVSIISSMSRNADSKFEKNEKRLRLLEQNLDDTKNLLDLGIPRKLNHLNETITKTKMEIQVEISNKLDQFNETLITKDWLEILKYTEINATACESVKRQMTDVLKEIDWNVIGKLTPNWAKGYLLCDFSLNEQFSSQKLSPLHLAAELNDVEWARILISKGAAIHSRDAEGDTPLHRSVKHPSPQVLKLLLKNNANPDIRNSGGWTALHSAAKGNFLMSARLLVESGANINLLNDLNDFNGGTPLHEAAFYNRVQVAQMLLEKKADLEAKATDGWTPLLYAAWGDAVEAVELLLKYKANIDALTPDGRTILFVTAFHNRIRMLQFLIHKKPEYINKIRHSDGYSPLHSAAERNNIEATTLLLANGADVNALSFKKETPLHLAAKMNHPGIVQLLVDRNADINIKDPNGLTALDYAAKCPECRQILRDKSNSG